MRGLIIFTIGLILSLGIVLYRPAWQFQVWQSACFVAGFLMAYMGIGAIRDNDRESIATLTITACIAIVLTQLIFKR